jgi:probable lipoprotein NlpC
MKNTLWIAALVTVTALMGCTSVPERGQTRAGYATGSSARMSTVPGAEVDLNDREVVKSNLYAQYEEWKGTRYQIGGLSRQSVDCSGFVHITFKSRLGIVLPRSTDLQVELGQNIDKDELRPGDLVFFKTGRTLRHVGVYLEDGRFLHASSKLGVAISHLNDNYWKSAYWKAKRLEL